jgi:hypothetical protein
MLPDHLPGEYRINRGGLLPCESPTRSRLGTIERLSVECSILVMPPTEPSAGMVVSDCTPKHAQADCIRLPGRSEESKRDQCRIYSIGII